jgi:hypothetical protein
MSVGVIGVGLPTGLAGWKLLSTKSPNDFKAFSKDPVLQRDIAYLREALPAKATAKDLLADRRLQQMVLQAYGLDAQVGMEALMRKVLESDPQDPSSVAARMTDGRFRGLAADLNYGGIAIPAIPAVPSGTKVQIEGLRGGQSFDSFNGSFAGVSVTGLSLAGIEQRGELAATLQAAFRKADGGRSDITVTQLGLKLVFTDTRGRGKGDMSFTAQETGTARALLIDNTAGSAEIPGSGGPKVSDSALIEKIVQRYTQAKFEESLGETSETLRKAVYAKRMLPQVTSWYSVIADRNMAAVVEAHLGLPAAFGQTNVDQQKAMLEQRMDLADFKDPAKLAKMLDRYVAQSSVSEAQALSSSSGIVTLVQPVFWGQDSFSGSSSAALFSILAGR